MKADKTIVIGLDGAHFELIEPWLESGELPNIQKCIEEGFSADSEACLPPVTSPNWKCYSTGLNPAELGIFWWENIDLKNKKVYYPYNRKNEHKEIWDYLSEAGYKVMVIGTPLTYPPKKVNGIMISGGLDAEEKGFTFPSSLEKTLKNNYNYRVRPKHQIKREEAKAASEILNLIELRFKVALDLMEQEDFDFVQVTSFYLNVLQHHLWRDHRTKKAWQIVDEYVGKILEKEENINLIFMSDHGSNKIKTAFNINTWLHKEGYLKFNLNYKITSFLSGLGLNRENIIRIVDALGLKDYIRKIIPKDTIAKVPSKREMKKEAKTDRIDWKNSDAIASGQGPIYLLNKEKKQEIKDKLAEIKTPEGRKVLEKVYEKEELYQGKYIEEAPDLILDQSPNIHIKGSIGRNNIFESPKQWRAENKKQGIFIGNGSDFKERERGETHILNLAPTILNFYGIEKPRKMTGENILERN